MQRRRTSRQGRRWQPGGPSGRTDLRCEPSRVVPSVGDGTIGRWRDDAYLFWELPGVYAVGHPGRSIESDLAAALLYAGPGAMLSHGTAVWWLELLKYPPRQIHVSSPRRVMDRDNIVVHGRRTIDRIWHHRLPVTTPSQAIVDFAATDEPDLLRLVLANADFKRLLEVATLQASIGQGVHGTKAVREALEIHLPQLALARSRAERLLLILCQRFGIRLPDDVNVLCPRLPRGRRLARPQADRRDRRDERS